MGFLALPLSSTATSSSPWSTTSPYLAWTSAGASPVRRRSPKTHWAFRHFPWCPPEPRHYRQRRCRVVPFDLDGDVEVDVPPSSLTEVWTSRSRSSTSPRCLSTAATTMLATSAMSQSTTARRCCLRRSPRRRRPSRRLRPHCRCRRLRRLRRRGRRRRHT